MVRLTKRTEVNIIELVKFIQKFFAHKISKEYCVYNSIKMIDGIAYHGRLNTVLNYTRHKSLMTYGKYIEMYKIFIQDENKRKKLFQLNGRKMFARSIIDLFGLIVQTLRFFLYDKINIDDFKRELQFFISVILSIAESKKLSQFWDCNNFIIPHRCLGCIEKCSKDNLLPYNNLKPLLTPIQYNLDLAFYIKKGNPSSTITGIFPNSDAQNFAIPTTVPPTKTTNIFIELSILNTTNISTSMNQSFDLHEKGMIESLQHVDTFLETRIVNNENVPVVEILLQYNDVSQTQDSIMSMNILKKRVPDKSNYSTIIECSICQEKGVNCIIKCGHSFCVDCVRKCHQDGKGMVKCAMCTRYNYCSWIYL